MQILHIGKYYSPYRGGIEAVTRQLAEAAVAAGHEASALVHAGGGGERHDALGGVVVVRSPVLVSWLYAPLAPLFLIDLFRSIWSGRPDLIHIHAPNPSAFWLLFCPPAWRVPWVLHWHSDVEFQEGEGVGRWIYQWLYRPLEKWLLRKAAAVVVTSPNYLASSKPLEIYRDKCRVIPLSVEDQVSDAGGKFDWPDSALRVLMVGRNTPYKGHKVLLEAVSQLATDRQPVSTALIGVSESDVRGLAPEGLLSSGDLQCIENASTDELGEALRSCDLLCLPSLNRAEAFGLVLLEAMAVGKPLVVSELPDSGVGWLVENDINGWTFPVGDSDALAARLRWCMNHTEAVKRAGESGRARVAEHFSNDHVAAQWLELYEQVIHGRIVTNL